MWFSEPRKGEPILNYADAIYLSFAILVTTTAVIRVVLEIVNTVTNISLPVS